MEVPIVYEAEKEYEYLESNLVIAHEPSAHSR